MPFISRDSGGLVTGLFNRRQFDGQEQLPDDHEDVVAYRTAPEPAAPLSAEELYDMLEAKGVVVAADRPRGRS